MQIFFIKKTGQVVCFFILQRTVISSKALNHSNFYYTFFKFRTSKILLGLKFFIFFQQFEAKLS